MNTGDACLLRAKMVSRVTPAATPRPVLPPAPPSPDSGVIAELTAQNSKLIAMLDTQNERMLALLERMVQHNTPGAATVHTDQPRAAANITAAATPPQTVEVCAPELNEFGEETLTHITGEQVKAILDDGLRAASVSEPAGRRIQKAAEIVALKVAKLIYSIPENRTWYVTDDHRAVSGDNRTVMNYSDGSWVASWYGDVVEIIGQTVLDVLNIKLPREDKSMYACFITSMAKMRPFTPDHLYIVSPGFS